ncbi:MAG: hypothetical protein KAI38_08365, partial [Candidatus Latescibacteria bacterium]|nr:hypothetical protein [Candidatus Latescibacterota bacterium]
PGFQRFQRLPERAAPQFLKFLKFRQWGWETRSGMILPFHVRLGEGSGKSISALSGGDRENYG